MRLVHTDAQRGFIDFDEHEANSEVLELDIIGVNVDGDGIAEFEGRGIAVPGTIPGERVEARLVRARDGFAAAEVVRIVVPSPHRVAPGCRHFGPCGGCAWQHIAYAEQLRLKQRMLQDLLPGSTSACTLPTPSEPGASAPWHYRNKVSFVFGPGAHGHPLLMGHYRRGSRTVVPVQECPVHAEAGNRFAFAVHDVLVRARIPGSTPDGEDGVARHVVARVTEGARELLGTLVVTENVKPLRRVTTEVQKAMAPGAPGAAPLARGVPPERPRPSGPHAVRPRDAAAVRRERGPRNRWAACPTWCRPPRSSRRTSAPPRCWCARCSTRSPTRGSRRVLDLYAGVGLFALPLAKPGRSGDGGRGEPRRDGERRIGHAPEPRSRSRRAAWSAARVEEAIGRARRPAWDAVVLDPPRQGCPPAVLDWVFARSAPARIVYVSCNPEALARDLARSPRQPATASTASSRWTCSRTRRTSRRWWC